MAGSKNTKVKVRSKKIFQAVHYEAAKQFLCFTKRAGRGRTFRCYTRPGRIRNEILTFISRNVYICFVHVVRPRAKVLIFIPGWSELHSLELGRARVWKFLSVQTFKVHNDFALIENVHCTSFLSWYDVIVHSKITFESMGLYLVLCV